MEIVPMKCDILNSVILLLPSNTITSPTFQVTL